MKIFLLLHLILLAGSSAATAQTRPVLDSLDKSYQQCINRKGNLYGCVVTYYKGMDSLLQRSYRALYARLDTARQRTLRADQQHWEEKRTAYFELLDARVGKMGKKTPDGLDDRMISTDNKAAYLRNRVLQLEVKY
ncbi:MAG TPA: lysozyme inhibitor LprI family protein [Chitinophaga sp.]